MRLITVKGIIYITNSPPFSSEFANTKATGITIASKPIAIAQIVVLEHNIFHSVLLHDFSDKKQ